MMIWLGDKQYPVNIYLLQGNSNLVLGQAFLETTEWKLQDKILNRRGKEISIRLEQDEKGNYMDT